MNKANEDNLSFRGRELRHPAPTRAEATRSRLCQQYHLLYLACADVLQTRRYQ